MGLSDAEDTIMDAAEKGSTLERYADKAMYQAEPIKFPEPQVHLIWMTPDPLGAIAAACRMYEGKTCRSITEISDDERRHYWEQVKKTHLKAPLEFVKMHFFLEGVDRAFTHQLVRQRTAVYAQESLRFAVKENLVDEVPYPPSFSDPEISHSKRNDLKATWLAAVQAIDDAYRALIANGVPAEDARGLLPTSVQTRVHYCTDLRNLLEHAGNRLCTQAQFHWRQVFTQIRECIANYAKQMADEDYVRFFGFGESDDLETNVAEDKWQFELIATDAFKPVCYEMGRCPFKAEFDRGCTIRPRVDAGRFDDIKEEEWLLNPKAGWVA